MNIRQLEVTDAEQFRNLRIEALKNDPEAFSSSYEEEKTDSLEVFRKKLSTEHVFTYGAFQDHVLVGIFTLVMENKLKLKHRTNLVGMYVTVAKRGEGIGRDLMSKALSEVRKMEGIEQVYLSVSANNHAAKKLYRSSGFEVFGLEKKSLKVNHQYLDTEHMVLFL
jgi:ribosomal protein S18 acetylase RimI-like enzyme